MSRLNRLPGARRRTEFLQLGVAFAVGAGVVTLMYTPGEPYDSLFETCRACGLADAEIEELVRIMRKSPLSRSELIEAYRNTFRPDDDYAELCDPSAEAVLNAAGR